MPFTTTAGGNPPHLSPLLCDLANLFQRGRFAKSCTSEGMAALLVRPRPVLVPAGSTVHIAHPFLLCDWPHSTSVTNPLGHALGNDQRCARKPSAVLHNQLSSLVEKD